MNILHISSAKSWRGGERQVHLLISGQACTENNMYLMCPTKSPLHGKCKVNIKEFIPYRNGAAGFPANLMALIKICKAKKIDIIHGHDSHSHTLIWMAYKMTDFQIPSVVTRRLNNPIRDKSKAKYNHPGVKRIICISEAVKETMLPQIDDVNRIVKISSGIDLGKRSEPKYLDLSKDLVLGYVAAFTEEKDHQLFAEVALDLIQRNINCQFLLVGEGPLLEKTKDFVAKYADKFEFTGFVNDVDAQYNRMDILLHTAKSEALGTSILDGMKFGLPIIANDVGGIKEIVGHGKNGFLVKDRNILQMSDYVISLIEDIEMYTRMSERSLEMVKPYGNISMVHKTMDLYKEILEM